MKKVDSDKVLSCPTPLQLSKLAHLCNWVINSLGRYLLSVYHEQITILAPIDTNVIKNW